MSETLQKSALNLESLNNFKDKALAGAGDALGNVKNYLSNNPSAAAMLLGGGASSLMGGWLASRNKGDDEETQGERRKRILMNALLAGGLGAGAVGAGIGAYNKFNNAIPQGESSTGPVADAATGLLGRGTAAGVVGAGLYRAGLKRDTQAAKNLAEKFVNSEYARTNKGNHAVQGMVSRIKELDNPTQTKYMHGSSIRSTMRDMAYGLGASSPEEQRHLRQAIASTGIHSNPAKYVNEAAGLTRGGILKNLPKGQYGRLAKKHLGRLLGGAGPTQAGAGALLTAALFYPEILKGGKKLFGGAISGE